MNTNFLVNHISKKMLQLHKQCFCDSSWGASVSLSSQSSIHLSDSHKKTVFSVVTSPALILFQSEARMFSLAHSAVGCLRCGHHGACQQNRHSCEIKARRYYKGTTSHFQHKITVTAPISV